MADPLSISASIIAVLQLTSIVAQYLQDVQGASNERQRLLDEVSSVSGMLYLHLEGSSIARTTRRRLECHIAFIEWFDGTASTLFCPGIPGAGKTMIAATVVEHLSRTVRDTDIGLAYIYCNYRDQAAQNATNLMGSLLKQLEQQRGVAPDSLLSLYPQTKTNVDINAKDNKGRTPLWIAAYSRCTFIVNLLLTANRIQPNVRNNEQATPLFAAVHGGCPETARRLLNRADVDINAKDVRSWTPLMLAAALGRWHITELLVAQDNIDLFAQDLH